MILRLHLIVYVYHVKILKQTPGLHTLWKYLLQIHFYKADFINLTFKITLLEEVQPLGLLYFTSKLSNRCTKLFELVYILYMSVP